MERRDLVVIGASAGGVEPLRTVVSGLPADFPAAVLVVLHVPESAHSALPTILARSSNLSVTQATEGDELVPGRVLTAPPGRHLVVYDHKITLSQGPRENGHRPAVDVLFRSAARAHGQRVIGVVLSGALDDGTAGMLAVRARGGIGIAQDPSEALHPSMPMHAIAEASPEFVLPVEEIPKKLVELVNEPAPTEAPPPSPLMEVETAMAVPDPGRVNPPDRPGVPAGLSCPDCGGTLFRLEDKILRFRCRVGHAWAGDSLVAQQSAALETALWMALRGLEEKAALTRDMAARARGKDQPLSAQAFDRQRVEAESASLLVRDLLARVATGAVDLTSPSSER